jgi:hypothetical protein
MSSPIRECRRCGTRNPEERLVCYACCRPLDPPVPLPLLETFNGSRDRFAMEVVDPRVAERQFPAS